MNPSKKAQEIFDSGEFTNTKARKYFEEQMGLAKTRYMYNWWKSVRDQYETLIIKKKNDNKS